MIPTLLHNGEQVALVRDDTSRRLLRKILRTLEVLREELKEQVDLLDGLVAYWKLEETSGITRVDATGRGNNVSDVNANVTQVSPGKIGNGAGFPGVNAYLLKSSSLTDFEAGVGVSFSFAGWVKVAFLTNQFIIGKTGAPVEEIEWKLQVLPPNWRFEVRMLNSTTRVSLFNTSFGTPPTGAWLFIFCAYDSPTKTLYISTNDGPKNAKVTPDDVAADGAPLALGARAGDGAVVLTSGVLDEWGFWRRQLTDTEVTALYNRGSGLSYPFS